MGRITYLRFAFSLFFRDATTSFLHIFFSTFFATGLILSFFSIRTDKSVSDVSSIDLFRNSPYLVLALSSVALIFMGIVRTTSRSGDTGIMMAVGGNRFGCILLETTELWIIHGFGFLLASLAGVLYPPGNPALVSVLDYVSAFFYESALLGLAGGCTAFLHTLVDPYRSIRRGK
ncbi:ABC transporter permease [Leptospira fletcheri]|uniref:ABC transporter permease n=1 Tax=Leptospira fletcheri TaxID=2484981 RepID=A0A4R9GI42_9LEPT|nr:ABC transporter permease [Leptospira fletcheri]TGK12418.1 ABC transporter permease [Leptospira fletcheri]